MTFSPYESLLESFFDRFPLILEPQHRYDVLSFCLVMGLETLSSLSTQTTLSKCSFQAIKKRMNTWILQSASVSCGQKSREQDGKYFDDPFQVYPNWWGNAESLARVKKEQPTHIEALTQKWVLPSSQEKLLSKAANRSDVAVEQLQEKKNPGGPISTEQSVSRKEPKRIPAKLPQRATASAARHASANKNNPLSEPKPRPPPPAKKKAPALTFSPPSSKTKARNIKRMVQMANQYLDDPIFQLFQTHQYLDEKEDELKQQKSEMEWFKQEWAPSNEGQTIGPKV